jgi:hypothetical protein
MEKVVIFYGALLGFQGFAFDVFLENKQVVKDGKTFKLFSENEEKGSVCHPPAGFYESSKIKSNSLKFSSSSSENLEVQVKSLEKHLVLSLSESQIILENSSKNVEIYYNCISEGWEKVELRVIGPEGSALVIWNKHCGEEKILDFSLIALLIIAVVTVYISAYRARLLAAWQPRIEDGSDVVTVYHAYGFVVMASLMLVILFLFKEYLNFILELLIVISAGFALVAVFDEITSSRSLNTGQVSTRLVLLITISSLIVLVYIFSKHWLLNNLLGLCMAYVMIKSLKVPDFKVGSLLLSLTLVYDILWVYFSQYVFGDNVMVAVASGLDLPIKLLFPHFASSAPPLSCSMLGLGDLALPGVFLAFASRFDHIHRSDYLQVLIFCYCLALAICVGVLVVFQHAQPALLFISPALIVGMGGNALRRKEMGEIWNGLQNRSLVSSAEEEMKDFQ